MQFAHTWQKYLQVCANCMCSNQVYIYITGTLLLNQRPHTLDPTKLPTSFQTCNQYLCQSGFVLHDVLIGGEQNIEPSLPDLGRQAPPHRGRSLQLSNTAHSLYNIIICDRIWENPPYGIFSENWVWCKVDKLYHRANPRSSLRSIACFVVEIQRFVCDRATPPIIEKLRSNGCTRMAFPHTTVTRKSIKWTLGGAVRNEHKDRARVEFRCWRQPIVPRCPRS